MPFQESAARSHVDRTGVAWPPCDHLRLSKKSFWQNLEPITSRTYGAEKSRFWGFSTVSTWNSTAARRGVFGGLQHTLTRRPLKRLVVLLISHRVVARDFGNFAIEVVEIADDFNCFLYFRHFLPTPKYRHGPDPSFGSVSSR